MKQKNKPFADERVLFMNEPIQLAALLGSSLNVENKQRVRQTAIYEKTEKKKRRKIPRAVLELRDPDGLDIRDLLGL